MPPPPPPPTTPTCRPATRQRRVATGHCAAVLALAALVLVPAYGQVDVNPSLVIELADIDPDEFNTTAGASATVGLETTHSTSWQVTLDNNLVYANPDGDAVIRIYDANRNGTFIEVGMGAPPERTFWVGVQLPEEGYVPIHSKLVRGWGESSKTIVSYTDRAGLTVNNGARIVVTNLDIGVFAVDGYSVHGKKGSTDPPAAAAGGYTAEFLSGDPSQNMFSLYPFFLAAAVGTLVGVLFVTKKRSSSPSPAPPSSPPPS